MRHSTDWYKDTTLYFLARAFENLNASGSDEKDRPTLKYGPTFILLCPRLKYRYAVDQLEGV